MVLGEKEWYLVLTNLKGRSPFEVNSKEISKQKSLGDVFTAFCRKYVIPFSMA